MELKIEGMMCQHCVMHVRKALEGVEGVSDVNVSLEENNAKLNADISKLAELKAAVEEAGYQVVGVNF